MLRGLRPSPLARFAAALVALSLSGAPALARRAEPGVHRCLCKAHQPGQECECVKCRAAAARAEAGKLPPCHGGARPRPASEPSPVPVVTGTCGSRDELAGGLVPIERFLLPEAAAPPLLFAAGEATAPAGRLAELAREPETPPPRRA